MGIKPVGISCLCLALTVLSSSAWADRSRPTCAEEPSLRDCVKVEDPDATAPQPSVHRKPKPGAPVVRPLPAAGRAKAG